MDIEQPCKIPNHLVVGFGFSVEQVKKSLCKLAGLWTRLQSSDKNWSHAISVLHQELLSVSKGKPEGLASSAW